MLFRKLLPFLAAVAACFTTAAHAQIGFFATVTGERIGGVACQPGTGSNAGICPNGTVTDKPYGASFGGYYDFRSYGPIRVGGVIRGSVLNTNKDPGSNIASTDYIREYTAMGGVRASGALPIRFLRPYGELLVGYSKFGPVTAYNNHTKFEGKLGVDVPIAPFVDVRAIEFGAGALFGPSSHGVQSISAGIVFHAPRIP